MISHLRRHSFSLSDDEGSFVELVVVNGVIKYTNIF